MNERMDGLSMNLEQANLQKLATVFPEVMVEGRLDLEKLLDLLGQYDIKDFEKYKFEWKGKSECLQLAQRRSTATLRPKPDESVNWDTTNNVYIKGDNLEVLKLLQTSYFRKVKMIYIDPPYNTGNDFVYEDDFADPLARYKEVTEQTTKSNPETMGRFHTNWLNMMYPRLRLAANLLRDDGVIFISIDDHEVHNLRKLCDEVFGEENFEGQIHWRRRHNQPNDKTKMIGLVAEHIVVYAKNSETLRAAGVGKIDLTGSFNNPDNDPRGDWASKPWKVGSDQSGSRYTIVAPNGNVLNEEWMGEESTYKDLLADNRIIFPRGGDGMPRKKYFRFEREEEGQCATNWWEHSQFGHNQGANDCMTDLFGVKNVFSNPKPVELIRGLIQIANVKNDDIVLDFFSGSATTAQSIMQLNKEDKQTRQFILVQLPENLDENYAVSTGKTKAQLEVAINFLSLIGKPHFLTEIGMERIRRAGTKLTETDGQVALDDENNPSLDIGFKVFELDSSNIMLWDGTPVSKEQQEIIFDRMNDMIENVKPDRTEIEVVYEIMLKMGLPLTYPILPIEINGKKMWSIGEDCMLMICLARNITPDDVTEMCDYAPAKIVMADFCFEDTTAMANANYIMQRHGVPLKLL